MIDPTVMATETRNSRQLASTLFQRLQSGEGVLLDRATTLGPPHCCHANAEAYAERHPGTAVIRGWLGTETTGGAQFDAHSVVQDASGRLLEVTAVDCRPFLRHHGDDHEFMALRGLGEPLIFISGITG